MGTYRSRRVSRRPRVVRYRAEYLETRSAGWTRPGPVPLLATGAVLLGLVLAMCYGVATLWWP